VTARSQRRTAFMIEIGQHAGGDAGSAVWLTAAARTRVEVDPLVRDASD